MSKISTLGACPTVPEHGKLYRMGNDDLYACVHADHNRREYDREPAMRRSTWKLEELQALGVMP